MNCPTFKTTMYQALQPCYRRLPLQFTRQFSVVHAKRAGHNKWSKIKDKKGVNDRQKSILYSKASNEIITAARIGGSVDPARNIRLAAALKSSKDQGVPKENIQKALARAGGASNGSGQHFVYEALAHDSVGLIIECLTDNVNRTLHNVRDILTSYGARMTPVKFMFERQGLVTVALDKSIDRGFDKFFDIAIENGAEEVNERPDLETDGHHIYEISCAPTQLAQLTSANWKQQIEPLQTSLATILSSELAYVPADPQPLGDGEQQNMDELLAELEANNDTSRIWTTVKAKRPSAHADT